MESRRELMSKTEWVRASDGFQIPACKDGITLRLGLARLMDRRH